MFLELNQKCFRINRKFSPHFRQFPNPNEKDRKCKEITKYKKRYEKVINDTDIAAGGRLARSG